MDPPKELELEQPKRRVGLPSWLARRKPLNPKLMVVDGQATKGEIDVRLPMTIGREPGISLVISHPLVSRKHCELAGREDYLLIRDLNSANGTYVNGKRIHKDVVLKPGDKLTVGPLTFVVVYQQSSKMSSRQVSQRMAEKARKIAQNRGDNPDSVNDDEPTPQPIEAKQTPEKPKQQPVEQPQNFPATASTEVHQVGQSSAKATPAKQAKTVDADSPDYAFTSAAFHGLEEAVALPDSSANGSDSDANDEGSSSMDDLENLGLFLSEAQRLASDERKKAKAKQAKEENNHLSDDVSALLEEDMAARENVPPREGEAGQTMLAGSPETSSRLLDVMVTVKQTENHLFDDEDTSEEESSQSQTGEQASDQKTICRLIACIDLLQQGITEQYHEASVTAQLVSRLQMDQLDLIHEDMDRLAIVTKLLKEQIKASYPKIKVDDRAQLERRLQEALGPKQSGQDSQLDRGVEDLQRWLVTSVSDSRDRQERKWQRLREYLVQLGIDVPS
ncbi:Hypothetical protein PBC10988_0010 [Planctomycetales bacterium 10988]|nr:Hypothetical protein PBC10988_0010 [Planctomycetales bacterium 10988]